MGMDVGGESGGLNSQINVTPLADVMLVLLIIVMLIAPLLQAGVAVTLPEAANTVEKPDNDANTVLHVDAAGRFYVDNQMTEESQLLATVQRALDRKLERIVLIKADQGARYAEVMDVLDRLQRAGIEDIGLVTERRLRGAAGG
ncbi:MAG: biopolymer transporter ExbD [Acidobacteriota bacterium]|jgi:biopolymer transport protein ExbD|nr:biopolymer transporter ExbD [Acidobacteriota bacterium]